MSVVAWLYEGDDVTDFVEFKTARADCAANAQVGTAIIRIRDRGHTFAPGYFHAGGTLELFIDGERQWDGWAFDVSRTWAFDVDDTENPVATPRFWTLRGLDRNILFQKRIMHDPDDPTRPLPDFDETTTDLEALLFVANNFVDISGDGLNLDGITEIAIPGQGEKFVLGEIGGMWGTAFEDCSIITGGVYYIDPDRMVRYVDDNTVTAPWILSDNPAATEGAVGYREVEDDHDGFEMANDAFVWGAGRGKSEPVFHREEDDSLIAQYGRWQWSDQVVGASKVATVRKRAQTYIDGTEEHHRGHGRPLPSVKLTTYTPGFRVAQVARFIHETYGVDRALPIRRMTITFPTQTDPRYDLELSLRYDTPFMRVDPWINKDVPMDDPESHDPPPGSGEASVIDEFDRSWHSTDEGWTPEFAWGTASNGVDWLLRELSGDYYVESDLGFGQGHENSDDDQAHGSISLLDFPNMPKVTYWRWRMTVAGDPGTHGFDQLFVRLAADQQVYACFIHYGPADVYGPASFVSIGVEGGGPYIYVPMTLDQYSDWRYTRVELDDDAIRIRTWREDDGEPATWNLEMTWADFETATGWSAGPDSFLIGHTWYGGTTSTMPILNMDYIRGFGTQLTSPGTADSQNEGFNWDGGNLYQTAYPYLVGTLRVWLDGIALRWGIDYFESDPDQGEFRISDDFIGMAQDNLSSRLTVRYQRDVSYPTTFKEGPHRGPSAEGYTGSKVYRPRRQRQMGWGTRYDGINCAATTGAICLERHTEGGFSPTNGSPRATPPNVRFYSGNTVDGLNMGDISTAWSNGWSESLTYLGLISFGTFEDMLNEGRGASVFGLYSVIQDHYPDFAFSSSFRGPHALYVNEQFDDGTFLVYDPLANRALIYEREQLRAYMQSFTPQGLCNVSFSQVTTIS